MASNALTTRSDSNGKVPAGWHVVSFGDVVRDVKESEKAPLDVGLERYVGLEHIEPENLHLAEWGDLTQADVSFTKMFRKGQVLFGKRRAYQRKVAIAEFDGICSSDILTFEPKGNDLIPALLPFIVQSDAFFAHALGTSSGSLSPRTRWSQLKTFKFPLPPRASQLKIADLLCAATECVKSNRHLVAATESCKWVTLRHALQNGLHDEQTCNTLLGPLPVTWEVARLDEVAEFLDGKRVPLKQKDRAQRQGPYPYYGASGIIDYIDDFIFDEPLILLSEDGFNLVHRNSRIAFKVDGQYWVNNHAHVLRPIGRIHIDLLADYLESISFEPYITGTYQRKINKSSCEGIPIPVPPDEQQRELLRLITSFDDANRASEKRRDTSIALQKRLANSLVTGELDV